MHRTRLALPLLHGHVADLDPNFQPKAEPKAAASSSNVPATPAPAASSSTPAAPAAPAANTSGPAAAPATPTPAARDADPNALAMGEQRATAIANMESMGFERSQIDAAMRAAFYNPDRAVEYLLNVSIDR